MDTAHEPDVYRSRAQWLGRPTATDREKVVMLTNTPQPTGTQGGSGRCAVRLALACTVTLGSVALLATGPAQARIETPPDTGGNALPDTASSTFQSATLVPANVSPTHVAGLYGIHVDGGWLLR